MPLLLGGFADHLDGPLLTDDLIDEPLGDLHFRRGMEIDLANPRIHGGEFLRVSHRLHHLLTGPALGSRSNTRAFYLNTSRTLPRSSCRKSDTARGASSRCTRFCAPQNPYVALPNSRPVSDRKSTRLNSSHLVISYAVFCLKKK